MEPPYKQGGYTKQSAAELWVTDREPVSANPRTGPKPPGECQMIGSASDGSASHSVSANLPTTAHYVCLRFSGANLPTGCGSLASDHTMSTLRPFMRLASDPERAQFVALADTRPDTVPQGSMLAKDFVGWVRSATPSIQEAIITDVCWWEVNRTALRHEFLALRMKHNGVTFEILVERMGPEKTITGGLQSREAIDKVVLYPAASIPPVESLKYFRLFLGLMSNPEEILLPPNRDEFEAARLRNASSIYRLLELYVNEFSGNHDSNPTPTVDPILRYDAFVDALDEQRRGPPLRLCDLASYISLISTTRPRYSLISGNCFWYSRTLMHLIAVRHYSFHFIATTFLPERYLFEDWLMTGLIDSMSRYHRIRRLGSAPTDNQLRGIIARGEHLAVDASSVGHVFRILHYQEFGNGNRFFVNSAEVVHFVLRFVADVAVIVILVFCVFLLRTAMMHNSPLNRQVGFWLVGKLVGAYAITLIITYGLAPVIYRLQTIFFNRLRKETKMIIELVGEKLGSPQVTMGPGDYDPPVIPLVKTFRGLHWKFGFLFVGFKYGWHVQQRNEPVSTEAAIVVVVE
ncbi:hypothetical protein GGX14DRAFT_388446 [Mycena pura]|uniref:Uncharacterized protein n=1 Tax=Mycena pura TaxID=153505 RepID=A0AAD6VV13_9AGAR|nr:hypothetical protein GGX14DRAFT_388446 [Mycena pura]